ncbi:hypothetical protein PSI22_15160 [Xenorhabdus sp. XENO-7]|uniref:Uncharacterized protein n=1 Tax=Xenorhabdus aichiensis TaxID=3025874 RepID=A0ABT5M5H4_9GAMM|nr:hypothetical protein [Xenorhabdus aichiensis]MDC9622940.1 hypothetical protein [Xenorhabdus aichiensis]
MRDLEKKITSIIDEGLNKNRKNEQSKAMVEKIISTFSDTLESKLSGIKIITYSGKYKNQIITLLEVIGKNISNEDEITNQFIQNVYVGNTKEIIISPIFSWEITSDSEIIIKEDSSITYCVDENEVIEAIGNIIKNSSKFWSAVNKLTKKENPASS